MDRTYNILIKILNKYHKTNHAKKDWDILLKRWFVFNKKYLSEFLNFKQQEIKIYQKSNLNDISNNSLEFFENRESKYLCKILKNSSKRFLNKNLTIKKNFSINNKMNNFYLINSLKKIYLHCIKILIFFSKKKILIFMTGFNKSNEIKLNFKLNKVPIYIPNYLYYNNTIISPKRNLLESYLKEFKLTSREKFILYYLIYTMPKTFVENFNMCKKSVYYKIFNNYRKIITRYALFSNDIFKIWLLNNKRKTCVFQIQHGMDGALKKKKSYDYETSLSDKYLVWAKHTVNKNKDVPIGIKPIKKLLLKNKQQKFVSLILSPLIINGYISKNFKNNTTYDLNLINNIKILKKKYGNFLLIKFHNDDLVNISIIKEKLDIDDSNVFKGSFNELMCISKMLIFNYISTGILESIAHNKKIICINHNKTNLQEFRNHQKLIIKKMIKKNLIIPSSLFNEKILNKVIKKFNKGQYKGLYEEFKKNFVYLNKNYINDLIKIVN